MKSRKRTEGERRVQDRAFRLWQAAGSDCGTIQHVREETTETSPRLDKPAPSDDFKSGEAVHKAGKVKIFCQGSELGYRSSKNACGADVETFVDRADCVAELRWR